MLAFSSIVVLGGLAVAVPGEIMGYYEAKERFGNPDIPMKELMEPTIRMCEEEGLPVTNSLARAAKVTWDRLGKDEVWRSTFEDPRTCKFYEEGMIYKRPVLAQTLRTIAENGAKEFYEGETAEKMVHDLTRAGGIITMEDLKNYRLVRHEQLQNARFQHNNNNNNNNNNNLSL